MTSIGQIAHALRYYRKETLRLIAQIGMGTGAMAVVGGTVAIVGFVTLSGSSLVAIQGFASLGNIGVEAFTGFFAALINVRIAGPVVTGVALAATVGAGATAELGAMRISEEIDALEVMGIKSISFLASTRIMAGLVVIIPLYALAMIMSFLSPQITTTVLYGQSNGTYEHYFQTFLRPDDVFWSFLRPSSSLRSSWSATATTGTPPVEAPSVSARPSADRCVSRWSRCRSLSCLQRWRSTVSTRTSISRCSRMTTPGKLNKARVPPYKTAGLGLVLVFALVVALVYLQFRGEFTPKTQLTMLSARAGLVMDPGSKVTYNGVEIGRVDTISEVTRDGESAAKFILDVDPRYIHLIPANVNADIKATTVFGGKYVSLTTPKNPTKRRITPKDVIDVRSVTTEINTLFQTLTSIAEKVDPVKLNLTLSAAAEALTGLGDKFGESIVNANTVLDDLNSRMPQSRHDIQQLAALGDVYADAAPDLFDFLDSSVTTARTINAQQAELDSALLAAAGFGNTTADVFDRGGPYLQRGSPTWSPPPPCSTLIARNCSARSATSTMPIRSLKRRPVAVTATR